MNEIFATLNSAYNSNDFSTIFRHQYGNYFLKLRSLSRVQILRQLAESLNIDISDVRGRQLFEYLFCENIPEQTVDDFIRMIYQKERLGRRANEDFIYGQLYRLHHFNWGGFFQNAVEQTIVNNYIKKIKDYNQLINSIENDLTPRLKNYILSSWYNHWTSVLIEDMFKDHEDILPSVGLVKKVDFFWNNFPFDLKVTYFPDGFMKLKRQQKCLKSELAELKSFAKENNVYFDKNASDTDVFSELLLKIAENPHQNAKNFLNQFHEIRQQIISEAIASPKELIIWLYENQGMRRFDAANRFFIVLIDINNLEESWKLKRNKDVLSGRIHNYLNANRNLSPEQIQIDFNWEGQNFRSYATCLFILRE